MQAAGLTEGSVFRRIWLPPRPKKGALPSRPEFGDLFEGHPLSSVL